MKKYYEKINQDELEEVFRNNEYIITNSDRIFGADSDEIAERDSLFVICKDLKLDPYVQKIKALMGPLSVFIGGYADDVSYRIFRVHDYYIDKVCALYPEEVDEERLHNLNETYRFKMACKFPEYKQDFESFCETMCNQESPEDEMGE